MNRCKLKQLKQFRFFFSSQCVEIKISEIVRDLGDLGDLGDVQCRAAELLRCGIRGGKFTGGYGLWLSANWMI